MGSHYSSRLVELASEISKQTTVVDDYLTAHGYELSFSTDRGLATFPADAPAKVLTARQRVCEATKELYDLTTGPAEHLRWLAWRYFDVSSLRLIYYFNIAELVPLDSMISFDQLAEDAQVPVRVLRPYLRQAMTNNLFSEPKPGYVSHTIGSSLLPKSKSVRDWIGYVTEEGWPSSLKAVEAIEKWGPREEPNRSPFNLAFDTSLPYFQYLSQHPHRAERFGGCMDALMKTDGYNIRHLVNGFAWDRLEPGSTVVDIGGSIGHASIAIGRTAKHLNFVVQDLSETVAQGELLLKQEDDEHLKGRVTFQVHDFFTPQPIHNAEVYLLRFIMHDYPDERAVEILKQIVPVLGSKSRIVVMDGVLPEPNTLPKSEERIIRMMDMQMSTMLNSREREWADWKALFARADPRLNLCKVLKPDRSINSVMEVVLKQA